MTRPLPHHLPPWQEARRLALPATLSLLMHAAYRVNDQFWVRDLGPDAQAALGVTSFLHVFNFGFSTLLATGTLARVARAAGSSDAAGVRRAWHSAWALALPIFAALGIAGWLTTPLWVRACGAEGEVARLAAAYLGAVFLMQPAIAMKPVLDAAFIGQGNTMIPMLLAGLAVGLNFASAPLLIYGAGDWEGFGIAGAAWSTGLSRLVAVALGQALLGRWFGLGLGRLEARERAEGRSIAAIGAPVALSTIGYALVFVAVLKTSVQGLGRDAQAGLGVGFNGVESLSYCAMMGPAVAASSIVGRRLAAGDLAGARAGMRACLAMSAGLALATTALFLLAAEPLAAVFAPDAGVRAEAALYLRVVALSQVVTAVDVVLQQAMAGAGRTLRMSLINLACYAARVPMAAIALAAGWGAAGVWWALNASNYAKLVAMISLFRRLRLFAVHPSPPPRAP